MAKKAPSIKAYLALFIFAALAMLGLLSIITLQQIDHLRQEFQTTSLTQADVELSRAINAAYREILDRTKAYARWQEVRQQIQNPNFYAYWHKHRALSSEVLPDYTQDAAIYNAKGKVLSKLDTSLLPARVPEKSDTATLIFDGNKPSLLLYAPVTNKEGSTLGYVATLIRFLPELFRTGGFSQIDAETIHIERPAAAPIPLHELQGLIEFDLRTDPFSDTLLKIMTSAFVHFGLLMGLVTLLFYPFVIWLLSQPIQRVSRHIDLLRENPGESVPSSLSKPFQIAELEKIRQSLNAYHMRLNDVNRSLDQKNRELWKMAHHDPLTGAHNRRAFEKYWQELNDIFADSRTPICLALFDINHFKAINDSYGHQAGDQVLKVIAKTIQGVLRKNERLFRLGGDEFATFLINCTPQTALSIAERCEQATAQSNFQKFGVREPVRISIGLTHTDRLENDPLQSLQWKADVAMYSAKRPSSSSIALFTPAMEKSTQGLFSSWTRLAVYEAVTSGKDLHIYYQPIVDLESGQTHYYEALVRIQHGDELIMPSHIFPLVEARRLEPDLDRSIIEAIFRDLESNRIPPGSGVSINLSPPSVVDEGIIDWLEDFQPYVRSHKLVLEVTETALITQLHLATKNLKRLRNIGFEIALDDFGSGYSSFKYLATMPVDIVKFDISLVQLLNDKEQQRILIYLAKMIIDAGHRLVAEGIEDKLTAKRLRRIGFKYGQGYLFGKPAPELNKPAKTG
ncbi:putative bifunctional diguanylate cyclase/phosphodiesterase [Candidatus Endoriftia persephone]|jgi:diguanylate cyclase (GGDEF)-like protein|uniref:Bifunctional diguanylate cyclase/phosphodiesterase n=1 Tax=Candidatus Endoriftia persephonae TaxID=393765 RepID=A0A9J6ZWA1_9GAMM|nr:bifunctional diguanylate cyclase/phosphodiesterase [Candidatus Endoriftia persephone]USF87057.1 bifunctional diguanylate cyclase/phosphodiesterase [Candidatus Endoriftia persephone]